MNEFKFPTMHLTQTLYTPEQLQNAVPDSVHIALAGRSNVGKSSLVNALARRKQLAKISSTPGKTRSVNVYHVTPQNFYLTDLPGYGYAKRSKSERELWATLIENYLLASENLVAVAILLDCRLDPQEADKMMVQFALSNNIKIIPILTKVDKCTQKEIAQRQSQWQVFIPRVTAIPVSSHKGFGLVNLWNTFINSAENSPLFPHADGEKRVFASIDFERLGAEENYEEQGVSLYSDEVRMEAVNTLTDEVIKNEGEAINDSASEATEGTNLEGANITEGSKKTKVRTKRGATGRAIAAQKEKEIKKLKAKNKSKK